jgi:hypothetical protein
LREQILSLRPDNATFGFARNRDTATSAELEHAFVSKCAKCPQHGVGVNAQDGCHVVRGRKALTRKNISVGDVATDLGGDLVMEGRAVVPVNLDMTHGDKGSVTIVSSTRTSLEEAPAPDLVDHQLVIREARRRQRRRWLVIAVVIVAACLGTAIVGLSGRGATPKHPSARPSRTHKVMPVGPTSTGVVPQRPSSLAIGPNKNLYIADDLRNQVLERLPDGTFVPVACNGTVGFSGDGGPATSAELNYPSGITFGPDGTLYIADYGNGRIRAVSPAGIITTIAGNGGQGAWVADGTPALEASLQPTAVAFGPDALMYVADGEEVLRLGPNGSGRNHPNSGWTFTRVLGENTNDYAGLYGIGGPARAASADGADGVAVDGHGNIYVSGSNTKAILMVDTQGIVHFLGDLYPRGPGGLVTAPDGSVVAMDELGVVGLSPQGIKTLLSFPTTDKVSYLGITGFSPNGIAAGPGGVFYLDTFYGNGYADKSALIMIPARGAGSPSLLWEQRSP